MMTREKPPGDEPSFEIPIEAFAKSVPGKKDGPNEDAFLVDTEHEMFGVFDGAGGHAAGEVAAGIARDICADRASEISAKTAEEVGEKLERIFRYINDQVKSKAAEDPKLKEMGTTASVVKIFRREDRSPVAVIGNIGDSRVYRVGVAGNVEQVTLDDSLVARDLPEEQARKMQEKLAAAHDPEALGTDEKIYHKRRNELFAALGWHLPKTWRQQIVPMQDGEKLLLVSDGIHDYLTDAEIEEALERAQNGEEAVTELIEAGRSAAEHPETHPRAKRYLDDMTAVVVSFGAW